MSVEALYNWVLNNKEWVFSGIGMSAIAAVIGFIRSIIKRRHTAITGTTFNQHNSTGASGTQIGFQHNYGERNNGK